MQEWHLAPHEPQISRGPCVWRTMSLANRGLISNECTFRVVCSFVVSSLQFVASWYGCSRTFYILFPGPFKVVNWTVARLFSFPRGAPFAFCPCRPFSPFLQGTYICLPRLPCPSPFFFKDPTLVFLIASTSSFVRRFQFLDLRITYIQANLHRVA
ncbi:uncharacterized protein B0T23DRAFT_40562 [Neurospora hispaniola]|uniref:Uncharacterized protein n=1 Tax=Neurospora hispaniola TaxID=588809 RepID=A0AAJ0IH73_9PEZI|nr:hypothetical protein B0T23DRAFT_40562 [Neurospora hispaniola]